MVIVNFKMKTVSYHCLSYHRVEHILSWVPSGEESNKKYPNNCVESRRFDDHRCNGDIWRAITGTENFLNSFASCHEADCYKHRGNDRKSDRK